jgi:site-specific recombinase XerD
LRISEALALKRDDFADDGLVVRNAKFAKSRLLPLHSSTRAALDRYLAARDRLGARGEDLFVVKHGRAPTKVRVYCVFVRLARALAIRGAPGARGPRLHDLRHSFAVGALAACPPDRTVVTRHMLAEHLHGPRRRGSHLLVSPGDTGAAERHRRRGRAGVRGGRRMTPLAPHLTAFLRDHLLHERGASRHTIASYADSFALLLRFAAARLKRGPSDLRVEDLDVTLSARSSTIWRATAAMAVARATPASRPSGHFSATSSTGFRPALTRR